MKIFKGRSTIKIYNADCMPYLEKMQDNEFDLAIVDPPYGINIAKSGKIGGDKPFGKKGTFEHGQKLGVAKAKFYGKKDWDKKSPDPKYFYLLKQKTNNHILWGANHYLDNMPFNLNSSCWVLWDKLNGDSCFADCEIAWTSFKTAVRIFKWKWNGMLQQNMKDKETRIHPTQKPVALYKWLLQNYAKEGDTILDTHLGSGSIAIACWDLGFDLTAFEIDKDYYDAAIKRIEWHTAQKQLF